jgi:hypothetical protein
MPLRGSNRKVVYGNDLKSEHDGMLVPRQGIPHEFRGRGMGRAEEALVVVRAQRNGALQSHPFIDSHPIRGNDLHHGGTELHGLLLEKIEILLDLIRRDS